LRDVLVATPVIQVHDQQGAGEVDDDGGNGKKDIDGSMFPFVVPEPEQGHHPLDQPEESDAARQDQGTVQAGYMIKIADDVLYHVQSFRQSIY
jgi:hypothetical protein